MLLAKAKIAEEMIRMLSSWRHSGFNVYCGNRISPLDETAMENLARHIIRASFSQERMTYLDQEATVVYTAKDGKDTNVFPAMEWLAAMCSHIPNKGEQMVRCYGHCSNVSRGKRKEAGTDDVITCILEPEGNSKAFRGSWARLIQKIYEVDTLTCPKCQGTMRIISFIEDRQVIRAILKHQGLWLAKTRPPPKNHDPPVRMLGTGGPIDPAVMDNVSQLPVNDDHLYRDPEYSWDAYAQA
jgi:hypothetical protein